MAVNNVTFSMSLVAALASGDIRQILVAVDDDGKISVNDSTLHDDTAAAVDDDTVAFSTFSITDGGNTYTIASTGASTEEVASVSLNISGRVAYDDNTHKDFYYRFLTKVGGNIIEYDNPGIFDDAYQAFQALFDAAAASAGLVINVA